MQNSAPCHVGLTVGYTCAYKYKYSWTLLQPMLAGNNWCMFCAPGADGCDCQLGAGQCCDSKGSGGFRCHAGAGRYSGPAAGASGAEGRRSCQAGAGRHSGRACALGSRCPLGAAPPCRPRHRAEGRSAADIFFLSPPSSRTFIPDPISSHLNFVDARYAPCVLQAGDGPFVEIRLGGIAGATAAEKQCHHRAKGAGQRLGGSMSSEGGGIMAVPTSLVGHEASGIQQLSSAGGGEDAGGPSGAGERSEMSAARPSWMNAITGIFEVRTNLQFTKAYIVQPLN